MRLRQRQSYGPDIPMRAEVWLDGTLNTAFWSQPTYADGSAQSVRDQFNGPPPRINRKALRHMEVPPLNTVQCAKVSRIAPSSPCLYTCYGRPYKYRFTGGSLSTAPLECGSLDMPEQRPPRDFTHLQLIKVNDKEAQYLYQRALSKSSSAEYDFGVTVGEIAETAAFLAKPLESLVKISNKALAGVRAIYTHGGTTSFAMAKNATAKQARRLTQASKRHPIDTGLRIADESANHWLAYKFAVCPILDDIKKAMDFRDTGLEQRMGIQLARVKGPKIEKNTILTKKGMNHGSFYYDVSCFLRSEDRHYFGLYWKHNIQMPLLNFMEGLGFAPWQLPSLAWELVPLSFVVDRFIDIKSFVRGNIGSLTKQLFGTYCTRKVMTHYSYETSNWTYGWPGGYVVTCNKPHKSASALYERMARVVDTARPNFPVINPHWQDKLIADATNLSLIWGRLRTHLGRLKS